jgi:hypothetical protein
MVVALLVVHLAAGVVTADISSSVRTIKAVGPNGAAETDIAKAWMELSRSSAADLPKLIAALDDASPVAANWLRSAIDAVAERERAAGHALPAAGLESFLRETRHVSRGRRLAYELLCQCDPSTPKRLLPTMLDDPSPELRYDAVEAAFTATRKQSDDSTAAKAELRKLLSAARDGSQIEAIAKELTRRGEPVDLVAHFGYITRWQIAGPFDNTEGRGVRTKYEPERGVDLTAKYAGKSGREVTWRLVPNADKDGAIDLNRLFPDPAGKFAGMKGAISYGYAEVESPAERDVQVRVASATGITAFVNGREVLSREMYHQSFDRDMYSGQARLAKGKNTILVKVCQNEQTETWAQSWMFQVRLTDALGAAVPVRVVTPGAAAEGAK